MPVPLQPCTRAGGTRSWRKMVPTPGCSPAPRTGAFWSSAPSPRAALPRPTLYLGPAAAGPPLLPPPPLPLPSRGTWGPSVSVVCVRVAPGPEGRCTGMLCPLGSVHTVKSNCLKAVVLGFVFFPRFFPIPLYPVGKEALAALGPGSGAGSMVAPACSCCLTHFSATLRCLWKEMGPCGPAHSAGTGWVMDPPRTHHRATCSHGAGDRRGRGALESPTSHPWRSAPLAAPTSSLGRPGTAWLPARPGPTAAPAAQRKCLGVLGGATGFAGSRRGSGGCSPPSQLGPS